MRSEHPNDMLFNFENKVTLQHSYLRSLPAGLCTEAVFLFLPKYWTGHPHKNIFSFSGKKKSGSKYLIPILFHFKNQSTAKKQVTVWPLASQNFKYLLKQLIIHTVGDLFRCYIWKVHSNTHLNLLSSDFPICDNTSSSGDFFCFHVLVIE